MTGPAGLRGALRIGLAWAATGCGSGAPPAPAAPGLEPDAAELVADDRDAAAPVRYSVLPDPGGTVLAAAVVVPGSAWEVAGLSGLTMLTALTVLESVAPRLDSLGAVAEVECGAAAYTFTLVAAADRGPEALAAFLSSIFRPVIDEAAVGRARSRVAAAQRLARASPAGQSRLVARRALYGEDDGSRSWAAPPCGPADPLPRLDARFVRAAAHRFDAGRATAAVTGPVDPAVVERLLGSWLGPSGPAAAFPSPVGRVPESVHAERNTVTSWTAVIYPFGVGADVEAIRRVGALLVGAVSPGVERPSVYDVGFEVERHGGGGALIVYLVTSPDSVARYASAVEAAAESIAAGRHPSAVRDRVLLRQRGQRLAARSYPERLAAEVALELALSPGRAASWSLGPSSPGSERSAAASLGAPVRAIVGPGSRRSAASP